MTTEFGGLLSFNIMSCDSWNMKCDSTFGVICLFVKYFYLNTNQNLLIVRNSDVAFSTWLFWLYATVKYEVWVMEDKSS